MNPFTNNQNTQQSGANGQPPQAGRARQNDVSSYIQDQDAQFDKTLKDKSNKFSSQNLLQFAEIRDGLVIMNDGSFRAVVRAYSVNYDLMSLPEQENTEYAFQGFLNSLYFTVQILVRSRKIDMGPYLQKLTQIRSETDNMLLGLLMEDYVYFISDLVAQTNIMSKEFYVIVPLIAGQNSSTREKNATSTAFSKLFKSRKQDVVTMDEEKLEDAKKELRNRVQGVINGLMQMGVNAKPLSTSELIELYYNCYNPDTATRQTLVDVESLNQPVIEKGQGAARKVHLEDAAVR